MWKNQLKKSKSLDQGLELEQVLWQQHSKEEATWEREDEMKEKYPDLFE